MSDYHRQVLHSVGETVAGNHNPNSPIVIPWGPPKPGDPHPCPFAAILAMKPKERVATKSRLCIFAFHVDGAIEFADGIFAADSVCPMITSVRPFELLTKALRMGRREWSKLLNFQNGERPYTRVKRWQLVDSFDSDDLPALQFGATIALSTLYRWADMQQRNLSWELRKSEVLGDDAKGKVSSQVFASTNLFEQFCFKIGLSRKKHLGFESEFESLMWCLEVARRLQAESPEAE